MAENQIESNLLDHEWLAVDAQNNPDRWIHRFTEEELKDIDHALQTTLSKGHKTCETMTKEDFPLGRSEKPLQQVLEHVENDMGLFVLRGIPASKYTKPEMRMIYWGIGLNMGVAVSQSGKGDVLGDVKNLGDNIHPSSKTGRGYMSRVHLGFHTDSSDIVGLMVLQVAKSGGLSMICSSVAVRNEIARRRPDLLKVLYEDFYWSWKGNSPPGAGPYYKIPIFSEEGGRFSCRYIPPHIFTAQEEYPELPRLTEQQKEAIMLIQQIANEEKFHFGMMFEPGDIQFLNNHITLHARTEFEDGDTDETKRHLLRLWLCPPNSRKLSHNVVDFYRDQRPGTVRGGFHSQTGKFVFETTVQG
ncbi:hypothetical protein AYO22_01823 [Fonsecaea multimorphosa]|nr:hypothetical protein AYO22_01823 [Fonsecaea multimorphosa]